MNRLSPARGRSGSRSFPSSTGARLLCAFVAAAPVVLVGGFAFFYFAYLPHPYADRWLGEGRIIETATYLLALVGGVIGLCLAWRSRRAGLSRFAGAFYLCFGLGLLVLGMEEISWGQHLWHYETPEFIRAINKQEEMNLHNLSGWSGKNSLLRIAYAGGALAGCWLGRFRPFRPLAPSRVLLSWFVLVLAAGIAEFIVDFSIRERGPTRDFFAFKLAEVTELLVATSGALYLLMQYRRMRGARRDGP